MDTPKDPLSDDFSASDAIGELENFLRGDADDEAFNDSLEAESRGYEAQVIATLRELGMKLPIPVYSDIPLYRYIQDFDRLIRVEEVTGLDLSEADPNAPKPTVRDVGLISHASSIADAMALLKYADTDGASLATPYKAEAQFEILEDNRITELDKAQLLDALDVLVPVDGIDMTDQSSLDRLREQSDQDYERLRLNKRTKEIVNGLAEDELIPVYGEHDEYQRLITHLRSWLVHQKHIASGETTAEQVQFLTDHNMLNITEAATAIGISEDTLKSFIAKADFLL